MVSAAPVHSHSRKKLDLQGQRFGKLTVVGCAKNVGGRTAWRCRCDCGGETVVQTRHLRDGHVTSCGCNGGMMSGLTYVDGTCIEILRAKTVRRNNTSGVPGVDWMEGRQRWRATLCFQGKRYYLGRYERFEDAVRARKRAEDELVAPFLAQHDPRGQRAEKG